jgi:3-dehydroquinate dehydratase-2
VSTILLLSGPNLNLLGERQPLIYGTTTLPELVALATKTAAEHGHEVEHVQSNHEGGLIDAIHWAREHAVAIVINAAAFTHSSYAIADALLAFDGVKVELHLSNPMAREPWRRRSVLAPHVDGTIAGFGSAGYRLAIEAVVATLDASPDGTPDDEATA